MTKLSRDETASGIMRLAKEGGVSENALFKKTLERYLTEQDILDQYEESMKEDGLLVTKEYVKGRKNIYNSPAVAGYVKVLDSSNKTAATLMKIIKSATDSGTNRQEKKDELMEAINGGDDYDEETN